MKQRLENESPYHYYSQSLGAIHKQSIEKLANLKIPKKNINTLMKNIHQNAIKYLTYLVLNKRKLDDKQHNVAPPEQGTNPLFLTNRAHLQRGKTPHATTRSAVLSIWITCSHSYWYNVHAQFFLFFFSYIGPPHCDIVERRMVIVFRTRVFLEFIRMHL